MWTPLYKQVRKMFGEIIDPFFPVVTEHRIWYNLPLNVVFKRRINERKTAVINMLENVANFSEIPEIADSFREIYIEGYKLDKKRVQLKESNKYDISAKKRILQEIDGRIFEKSQEAELAGVFLIEKLSDRLVFNNLSQKNDFFKIILEGVLNTLENSANGNVSKSIGKSELTEINKKLDLILNAVIELKRTQDKFGKVISSLTDIIGD